jgi:adenylate kinase family enzyme
MIIWVDLPRRVCLWRVFRRAVMQLGQVRDDVAPGCPERLDPEFFLYVWNFRKKNEERIEAALRGYGQSAQIIRVKSDAEIAALLTQI